MFKKIFIIIFTLVTAITFGYYGYLAFEKYRVEAARDALLQEAKTKANTAIEKCAQEFKDFIDSRKSGAKPFSKDVISSGGLWNAAKCLSMSKAATKDCYEKYINDKFSEHIFTPDDFREATKRAIEGGVQDIQGIENELAVALQQTIVGRSLTPAELPVVEAEFQNTIEAARAASGDEAAKEAGGLVVTEVVTQIATQVFIRLGVSVGILTTATGNAWWSLGGSLVIGVAVNTIWNYFTHPDEKIEKEMINQLDTMSLTGSTAIREELTKIVEARSQFWQTSVKGSLQ